MCATTSSVGIGAPAPPEHVRLELAFVGHVEGGGELGRLEQIGKSTLTKLVSKLESGGYLHRNARGCQGSGVCAF